MTDNRDPALKITGRRLYEALEQLDAAITNEGPLPALHYKIMAKHRAEWPTLWAAIDEIRVTRSRE